MKERDPECAKCGSNMDAGYVLDYIHGGMTQTTWVEGAPIRSFWTGLKIRGRRKLGITTWRCTNCGYLESYAREG